MKQFAIAIIFSLALASAGCGNSSSTNTVNGNWSATLTGTQNLNFTTTLTQTGSTVSVTNLSFTTSQSCFSTGATATGSFTLAGTTGGVTTGTFAMTIQSATGDPLGSNTLALQGTLTNTTITGNWTLNGSGLGCTGSGAFTMTD